MIASLSYLTNKQYRGRLSVQPASTTIGDKSMIYARKVFEKYRCVIYLASDIKCLDYHTSCRLIMKAGESEYILSKGDVLLFRNALKPYIRDEQNDLQDRKLIFSSEDCHTYMHKQDAYIYMETVTTDNEHILQTVDLKKNELEAFYKAIDLRWYNRTLPVYR